MDFYRQLTATVSMIIIRISSYKNSEYFSNLDGSTRFILITSTEFKNL